MARVHRDPFEPIMPVLEADSPVGEYRKITDEILKLMPNALRYPRAAAEASRSFLMLRLGLHLGVRQKNLRQLLICPKGRLPTAERHLEMRKRGELRGDMFVLQGEVASEDAKSAAMRTLLGFDGVFKIRNELVVAGYFMPATDNSGDEYFSMNEAAAAEDGGAVERLDSSAKPRAEGMEEVVRYPLVEATGEFVPRGTLDLTIDLVIEPQAGETPVRVGEFPDGWEQIDVSVQIFAAWAVEIEALSSTIALTKTESKAAQFRLIISDDYVPGSRAEMHISFLNGTRVCGHLTRDLARSTQNVRGPAIAAVTDTSSDPAFDQPDEPSSDAVSNEIRIMPNAPGPTLSVTIIPQTDGAQTWMWVGYLLGTSFTKADRVHHGNGDRRLRAVERPLRPLRRARAGHPLQRLNVRNPAGQIERG